jgi:hypothetical protein
METLENPESLRKAMRKREREVEDERFYDNFTCHNVLAHGTGHQLLVSTSPHNAKSLRRSNGQHDVGILQLRR